MLKIPRKFSVQWVRGVNAIANNTKIYIYKVDFFYLKKLMNLYERES